MIKLISHLYDHIRTTVVCIKNYYLMLSLLLGNAIASLELHCFNCCVLDASRYINISSFS
jgi:hypothetical protein